MENKEDKGGGRGRRLFLGGGRVDKIEFRGRKVSKEPLETSYSRGLEIENDDYLFTSI